MANDCTSAFRVQEEGIMHLLFRHIRPCVELAETTNDEVSIFNTRRLAKFPQRSIVHNVQAEHRSDHRKPATIMTLAIYACYRMMLPGWVPLHDTSTV